VLDVLRQIRASVVAGDPAFAQELVELPAAHLCEQAGFAERQHAAAIEGQSQLPPDLVFRLSRRQSEGVNDIGRDLERDLWHFVHLVLDPSMTHLETPFRDIASKPPTASPTAGGVRGTSSSPAAPLCEGSNGYNPPMNLIADLQRIVPRDVDTLRREIELYPDDDSVWRELPGLPNSGGTLVLHLVGNLRHYFGAVLGGSGYVRDRPAEFSTRGVPRQELLQLIAAAHAEVSDALAHLDPARLEETYPEPMRGQSFSTSLFFLHLAVHLTYHLGQLDYHRRVVTGDAASAGALPPP